MTRVSGVPDISVDLEAAERREFMADNYLTEAAAVALLRIIERTQIRPLSLKELVRWLEQAPAIPSGIITLTIYSKTGITKLRFSEYQ